MFQEESKYSVFWISEEAHVIEVIVSLDRDTNIEGLMMKAIESLNRKSLKEDFGFSLEVNVDLFEIYFAKKSGMPKLDLPGKMRKEILIKLVKIIYREGDRRKHNFVFSEILLKSLIINII